MDKRHRKQLGKLIFAILARNPFEYGIVPEEGGWVKLKDLHWALMQTGAFRHISVAGLQQFFELFRPAKMEIKQKYVRALPEFHAPGFLEFPVAMPPDILHLPVRPRAHAHVLSRGVMPAGNTKWIVLWTEEDMAVRTGRRRDRESLIAHVRTTYAMKHGAVFHEAGGCIYLAQWLEPQWLELPPLPETKEKPSEKYNRNGESEADRPGLNREKMPGSFMPEQLPAWYGHKNEKIKGRHGKKRNKRVKSHR